MKTTNNKRCRSILAFLVVAVLALGGIPANAQGELPPTPFTLGDFGAAFELDAREAGILYRVHLNAEILRAMKQPAERDLAIFDAGGKPLPFIVREVVTPFDNNQPASPTPQTFTLPLFPLPGSERGESDLGDIVVRSGRDGRVVEIRGGSAAPGTEGGRFLLDLTPLLDEFGAYERYEIDIPLGEERDVAAAVDVLSSANLRDWRKIAENEPLIRLRGASGSIESRAIVLQASQGVQRYLMLTISGATPAEDAVTIAAIPEKPSLRIPDETETCQGLRQADGTIHYDTQGMFPIHEVLFTLNTHGVYSARIEHRRSESEEWRPLTTMNLFRTGNAGEESRSGPIDIRTNSRYFRVSFPEGGPESPPTLRIAWRPREAVFMAQGDAPYLLACGSEKPASSLQRPDLVNQVLSSVQNVPVAKTAGRRTVTETAASVDEGAQTNSNWQQYLVWTVLVLGALFFSWAAWSLMRKEKK